MTATIACEPCPEGFHWIGQPLTGCDQCGRPVWEHAGWAVPQMQLRSPFDVDTPLVLRPFERGERDALQRRWGVR